MTAGPTKPTKRARPGANGPGVDALRRELAGANADAEALHAAGLAVTRQRGELMRRVEALTAREATLVAERDAMNDALRAAQAEIVRLREVDERLKGMVPRADLDAANAELARVTTERVEMNGLRDLYANLLRDNERLRAAEAAMRAGEAMMRAERDALDGAVRLVQAELQRKRDAAEEQNGIAALKHELAAMRKERDGLSKMLTTEGNRTDRLREDLRDARAELARARGEVRRLLAHVESAKHAPLQTLPERASANVMMAIPAPTGPRPPQNLTDAEAAYCAAAWAAGEPQGSLAETFGYRGLARINVAIKDFLEKWHPDPFSREPCSWLPRGEPWLPSGDDRKALVPAALERFRAAMGTGATQ